MRSLRVWLLALDRFEFRLRVRSAKNRNAYVRLAAEAYEKNQSTPGWLLEMHRRSLQRILTEHYQAVIPHFADQSLKQIKSRRIEHKQVSLFQSLIREWIIREALRKATIISSTDSDDVRNAIQDGMDEGEGIEEIARRIRRVSQLTQARASVVARTETHAAATFGSIESVRSAEKELGVRMLKQWLPTLDGRTREDHAAMAGQDPIPMDEMFMVGGVMMDRPGDPSAPPELTINCRCALAYVEAE